MSEERYEEGWLKRKYKEQYFQGGQDKESELIPKIERLQAENERLKGELDDFAESHYKALASVDEENEKLQARIEKLEAGYRELQKLPVKGMGVRYEYPYWTVREIADSMIAAAEDDEAT